MANRRALLGLGLFLCGCQKPVDETGTGDTDATTSTTSAPGTDSAGQTGASETSPPTTGTATTDAPTSTTGDISTTGDVSSTSTTVDVSTTGDTATTEPDTTGTTGTPSGCDETVVFEGSLEITDATDLASLECIVEITGDLHVSNTNSLVSFSELGNVKHVGGSIVIGPNAKLASLDGLKSLQQTKWLSLRENPQLTSLAGLESLTEVGDLMLEGNHALTNVKALANLAVLGSLGLGTCGETGNDALVDLQGLENLTALGALDIDGNDALKSIAALPHGIGLSWLAAHNNPQLPAAMLEEYLAETMLNPEEQICGNAGMPPPDGLCGCTIPP
ncbi:hypothetical protein [Nannocystis sp. SCPEA4]|uniref:hypothetical protein n=1 Tax=Nannocystis sp. SCPEA4 TaxID=2996787 RepID=UPI0022716DC0|nr:hypothetical protein [Nannocystis sp. SCPEA4]MCY1054067.1 hypothetical protein [Nannocystis sp. SCPEA4]